MTDWNSPEEHVDRALEPSGAVVLRKPRTSEKRPRGHRIVGTGSSTSR